MVVGKWAQRRFLGSGFSASKGGRERKSRWRGAFLLLLPLR